MATGVLIIAHAGIAGALLATVQKLVVPLPLRVAAFDVPFDEPLDALLPVASRHLRTVDDGDGVLVLTDLYGATPANLAARLVQLGTPARRVSGASLPMLLRVLNYAELGLDALAAVAVTGGRNAVLADDP